MPRTVRAVGIGLTMWAATLLVFAQLIGAMPFVRLDFSLPTTMKEVVGGVLLAAFLSLPLSFGLAAACAFGGQPRNWDGFIRALGLVVVSLIGGGVMVIGHLISRTDSPASEAGVGRLHEATGRPVLTAAALGQEAWEGVIAESGERHGVFTWALLDALRKGDANNNGTIELQELASHVQTRVSKAELKDVLLGTISLAGRQSARFGSRGENFPLLGRLE